MASASPGMKKYLRILRYGQEFFPLVVLSFVLLLGYNLLSAVSLTLVIPFLEILFNTETKPSAPVPAASSSEIAPTAELKEQAYAALENAIQTQGHNTVLLWFCLALGVAILLKNLLRYLALYFLAPMETGVIRNFRNHLFDHLSRLSLGFFVRKKKGNLMNMMVMDVQIIRDAVVGNLARMISDPLMMLTFLGMMFLLSWQLTLFTLLVLPISGLVISKISRSLRKRARRGQAKLDDVLAHFEEFIGGIRIIKAFGAEDQQRERFHQQNERHMHEMLNMRRRDRLASPLTEVLSILVVLGIIYYGGQLILADRSALRASEFIGFIALFSQFLAPIRTFSAAVSKVQRAIASHDRLESLLLEPIEAQEQSGGRELADFKENIHFEDVSFSYDGETPVLRDIHLRIGKGQTLALVGPSGGGKSTLADLLCRFIDPTEGCIRIDGQDLRELNSRSLRQHMGIVTQEGVLFNASVRENIAFGQPEASEEAIRRAARVARAEEFIEDLPQGYDTLLGEGGGLLSGGQRQRLAIARAVLKNPPILVLDEATSALDSASEAAVLQALKELMHGRTVLVIAHRLASITHADCIATLDGGRIVERGTHAELMSQDGLYAHLYRLQHQTEAPSGKDF